MRKEASIEQWKTLYEAGTRIKELKPWEKFWDMDDFGAKRLKKTTPQWGLFKKTRLYTRISEYTVQLR